MAQVLLVIHGMGEFAGAPTSRDGIGWAEQVERALRDAARAYPEIDQHALIIEPVLYDDVFRRHAAQWEKLAQSLAGTPLEPLTSFMRDADQDGDFLWGSIGDVVQYRGAPLVQQNVHTALASRIAAAVDKHGTQHHYSVLAHSLGTAVAHDALRALATRAVAGNTVLQPPNFRFSNFFALANVSKLVWATTDDFYRDTCVRPLHSGLADDACAVSHYISFRHVADPIPSIVRFAPEGWDPARFEQVELRHFDELNVHGFVHYVRSPQVSDRILTRLFPAAVSASARAARFQSVPDYPPPRSQDKKLAVESVAALLDRLSGEARGKLELDVGRLVEALWQSRRILLEKLSA